jgi:hypothetical protein
MAGRLTPDEVKASFERISNWERWGKEDQRGALNFITAENRAAAARLAKAGEIVSLALPLSTQTTPENPQPVQHLMLHVGPARGCCARLLWHRSPRNGLYASRRVVPRLLGRQDVQRF